MLEDGLVPLAQGDLLIIPKGTRHRPVVTTRVKCLLIENGRHAGCQEYGRGCKMSDTDSEVIWGEQFVSEIAVLAGHLHATIARTVIPLRTEVDVVICQRVVDDARIDRLLDSLLNFAGHSEEALALFKRLGRYYYYQNPELVSSYVMAYKEFYDSDGENDEEKCDMTLEQLRLSQNADPSFEERVDIRNVEIDMSAPAAVRTAQYLAQIKNPYAFKCGDISVNIEFTPGGPTLEEAMTRYFKRIRS